MGRRGEVLRAVVATGVALAAVLAAGDTALADGGSAATDQQWKANVQKQLDQMQEIIRRQQVEIGSLKAQIKKTQGGPTVLQLERKRLLELVRQEVAKAQAEAWFTRWKLKGDFRYRHEWTNDGTFPDAQRRRTRHRVRLRVGAFVKVNDEWDVGLQLATGSATPTSTNQTLDTFFSSKAVFWDLMYARYRPGKIENLEVIFGKMENPFYRVGGSGDLIWDSDVRPEGIAFNYHRKACENLTVYFTGGGFWIDERQYDAVSNDTADTSLWAGQLYAKVDLPQIGEKVYVKSGLAYYDYGNIEGFPATFGLAGNTGDIARGLNRYAMDYDIWNPFVEAGFPVAKIPFMIFADFAINSAAEDPQRLPLATQNTLGVPHIFPDENDFGWMVGFQLGKAKKPGSWQVRYDYRDLMPDAVLGALTDADFIGGGTNGSGHKISTTTLWRPTSPLGPLTSATSSAFTAMVTIMTSSIACSWT